MFEIISNLNYNLKKLLGTNNSSFPEEIWKILVLYMFEIISNLRIKILLKWNSLRGNLEEFDSTYLKLFSIWELQFWEDIWNK